MHRYSYSMTRYKIILAGIYYQVLVVDSSLIIYSMHYVVVINFVIIHYNLRLINLFVKLMPFTRLLSYKVEPKILF